MNNDNIVNVAMDKDYYAQVMNGGGSGGGATDPNDENYVEYLDVSGEPNIMIIEVGIIWSMMLKFKLAQETDFGKVGDTVIMSAGMLLLLGGIGLIQNLHVQCSILPNQKALVDKNLKTLKEMLKGNNYGIDYDSIPRITKEQFYNLNE